MWTMVSKTLRSKTHRKESEYSFQSDRFENAIAFHITHVSGITHMVFQLMARRVFPVIFAGQKLVWPALWTPGAASGSWPVFPHLPPFANDRGSTPTLTHISPESEASRLLHIGSLGGWMRLWTWASGFASRAATFAATVTVPLWCL